MNAKVLVFVLFIGTVFGGFPVFHGKQSTFSLLFDLGGNLTAEQKTQVKEVFQNKDLTKQQIEDNLKTLFNGFGLSKQVSFTAQ